MKVYLITYSSLFNAIYAARTCHKSFDKSTPENNEKLLKTIIKLGHESVIEHVYYTWEIIGISLQCLTQLTRHRIASYSVQSTRFTLKKLLNENKKIDDLFVKSGNEIIDKLVKEQLEKIKEIIEKNPSISNDILKYALPTAYKTNLIMTINARSLRNFFKLRLSKNAHFEIRNLAKEMYKLIPSEHKILYEDLEVIKND
ncbi:MAG TPA: FAD-dependent thymidylate synthase [Candidatus Desulfofervidus auxilii]|uniref:Flavin-dependent thymidylate synthase n=1 Tax=Desulfofervidus auxilii TaxID=1621989 RepID=A0A7C0Y420_DESA2|nr:FAD-dependent thymidylate synthase [Candidatus Desulfofervidus auxilii]